MLLLLLFLIIIILIILMSKKKKKKQWKQAETMEITTNDKVNHMFKNVFKFITTISSIESTRHKT